MNVTCTVSLGGATLNVTPASITGLAASDEIILIANDGTDAVTGTLQYAFDTAGAGAAARTLNEGDVVLSNIGGSGAAGLITYRGGDGNDVAIILAGPVDLAAMQVGAETLGVRLNAGQIEFVSGGTVSGGVLTGGTVVS